MLVSHTVNLPASCDESAGSSPVNDDRHPAAALESSISRTVEVLPDGQGRFDVAPVVVEESAAGYLASAVCDVGVEDHPREDASSRQAVPHHPTVAEHRVAL